MGGVSRPSPVDADAEGTVVVSVFVAFMRYYEDRYVDGVYPTLAKAQAAHDHKQWSEDGLTCETRAIHHRRRLPIDVYFNTVTVPVVDGVATLADGRTVKSDAKYVSYPVLPDDIEYVIEETPGEQCSYFIQEMPYDPS